MMVDPILGKAICEKFTDIDNTLDRIKNENVLIDIETDKNINFMLNHFNKYDLEQFKNLIETKNLKSDEEYIIFEDGVKTLTFKYGFYQPNTFELGPIQFYNGRRISFKTPDTTTQGADWGIYYLDDNSKVEFNLNKDVIISWYPDEFFTSPQETFFVDRKIFGNNEIPETTRLFDLENIILSVPTPDTYAVHRLNLFFNTMQNTMENIGNIKYNAILQAKENSFGEKFTEFQIANKQYMVNKDNVIFLVNVINDDGTIEEINEEIGTTLNTEIGKITVNNYSLYFNMSIYVYQDELIPYGRYYPDNSYFNIELVTEIPFAELSILDGINYNIDTFKTPSDSVQDLKIKRVSEDIPLKRDGDGYRLDNGSDYKNLKKNTIDMSYNSNSSGSQSVLFGEEHTETGSLNNVFGSINTVDGNENTVFGKYNKLTNGYLNTIIGQSNIADGNDGRLKQNLANGYELGIFGNYNTVYGNRSYVTGEYNLISGNYNGSTTKNSVVIGYNNVAFNNELVYIESVEYGDKELIDGIYYQLATVKIIYEIDFDNDDIGIYGIYSAETRTASYSPKIFKILDVKSGTELVLGLLGGNINPFWGLSFETKNTNYIFGTNNISNGNNALTSGSSNTNNSELSAIIGENNISSKNIFSPENDFTASKSEDDTDESFGYTKITFTKPNASNNYNKDEYIFCKYRIPVSSKTVTIHIKILEQLTSENSIIMEIPFIRDREIISIFKWYNDSTDFNNSSFIFGSANISTSNNSLTSGYGNINKGDYSIVFGKRNISQSNYQLLTGKYGKYNLDYSSDLMFGVGVGKCLGTSIDRKNGIEVYLDGMVMAPELNLDHFLYNNPKTLVTLEYLKYFAGNNIDNIESLKTDVESNTNNIESLKTDVESNIQVLDSLPTITLEYFKKIVYSIEDSQVFIGVSDSTQPENDEDCFWIQIG